MSVAAILSRISLVERELFLLKSEVKRIEKSENVKTLADLRGVWAGQVSLSEEDIETAQIHFNREKWNKVHEESGNP
jgi:hypothetical protein